MYFLATPTQFASEDARLRAQGFNVTTMSISGGPSNPVYSVSWRQLWQFETKSKGLQDYQVLPAIASQQAAGWTIATFARDLVLCVPRLQRKHALVQPRHSRLEIGDLGP